MKKFGLLRNLFSHASLDNSSLSQRIKTEKDCLYKEVGHSGINSWKYKRLLSDNGIYSVTNEQSLWYLSDKLITLFILIIMLVVSSCSSNAGISTSSDSVASSDLSEDSSADGGDEREDTVAGYTTSSAHEFLDAGEEEKDDTSEQSAPTSLDTVNPHTQALFYILQDIINKQENAYEI